MSQLASTQFYRRNQMLHRTGALRFKSQYTNRGHLKKFYKRCQAKIKMQNTMLCILLMTIWSEALSWEMITSSPTYISLWDFKGRQYPYGQQKFSTCGHDNKSENSLCVWCKAVWLWSCYQWFSAKICTKVYMKISILLKCQRISLFSIPQTGTLYCRK